MNDVDQLDSDEQLYTYSVVFEQTLRVRITLRVDHPLTDEQLRAQSQLGALTSGGVLHLPLLPAPAVLDVDGGDNPTIAVNVTEIVDVDVLDTSETYEPRSLRDAGRKQ